MNKDQQRVTTVLTNMIAQVTRDPMMAKLYQEDLEVILNDRLYDDAFGTEGQNDPRGDQRDGPFSMVDVKGIDY